MIERMKKFVFAVFCHRVLYGGLAVIYGAWLAGLVDKGAHGMVVCALYAVLAVRG